MAYNFDITLEMVNQNDGTLNEVPGAGLVPNGVTTSVELDYPIAETDQDHLKIVATNQAAKDAQSFLQAVALDEAKVSNPPRPVVVPAPAAPVTTGSEE